MAQDPALSLPRRLITITIIMDTIIRRALALALALALVLALKQIIRARQWRLE
jgi:hypothetical protein